MKLILCCGLSNIVNIKTRNEECCIASSELKLSSKSQFISPSHFWGMGKKQQLNYEHLGCSNNTTQRIWIQILWEGTNPRKRGPGVDHEDHS